MKQIASCFVFFILLPLMCIAQESTVVNAFLYQREGELDKAKVEIDKSSVNEKTISSAKNFYYRGLIYEEILTSPKQEYSSLSDSAGIVAYNSYKKALALDKPNGQWVKLATPRLNNLWSTFINEGIKQYTARNYKNANSFYVLAQNIKPSDTLAYVYSNYVSEAIQDSLMIYYNYTKLKGNGYKSVNMYYYLSSYARYHDKDLEKAASILAEGRKEFPSNKDLLLDEMNLFLQQGKFDQAKLNMEAAIEREPTNSTYYFNLGALYDQKGDSENAKSNYKKALEINPNEYDALYNLGAISYKKGGELIKIKNNMDQKQYAAEGKKYEADIKALFEEAMNCFEKIWIKNKSDESLKRVLKDIYTRLNNTEKLKAIDIY